MRDRTHAVVADFDADDPTRPVAFIERARELSVPAYLERSKAKGWHIWVFLETPGLIAAKARGLMRRILEDIGVAQVEVFPKQDRLDTRNRFGNFINAPLFGASVQQGRTVFVDPSILEPFADQWTVLASVQRVTDDQLGKLAVPRRIAFPGSTSRSPTLAGGNSSRSYGLAPCAQRMLREGVTANQRVSCFRLAVHLKKAGIPRDIAAASLRAWALKSRPSNGKRVLTEVEVDEQIAAAYGKDYRGCGCEDAAVRPFCDHACPLHRNKNANSPPVPNDAAAPLT
jgi:hypothetical protein